PHDADALGAEPVHAVLVAVDPEVTDDVLVLLRGVHLSVMRLVEGRIDEHQVARLAAHDPHVILLELERLVRAAAGRARAAREQLLGDASMLRDELVDWMRALLDEALVRAAWTQLVHVDRLV